jgi:hypothetical protein
MKPRILVVALIAALAQGCASTDKNRLAYQVAPVSTLKHGTLNATSYYKLARYYHGQKRLRHGRSGLPEIHLAGRQPGRSLNALGSLYANAETWSGRCNSSKKPWRSPRTPATCTTISASPTSCWGTWKKPTTQIRKALAGRPVSLERAQGQPGTDRQGTIRHAPGRRCEVATNVRPSRLHCWLAHPRDWRPHSRRAA